MKIDKKKIKELMLTDLLDEQMSASQRQEILALIDQDPELKVLWAQIQRDLKEPIEKIPLQQPPAEVWHNIREAIKEDPSIEKLPTILERIFDLLHQPKPIFAFATAMSVICIIITGIFFSQKRAAMLSYDKQEQIEYLSLLKEQFSSTDNKKENLGTHIEKYFL